MSKRSGILGLLPFLCLSGILAGGCKGKSELEASVTAGARHLRIFHTNNVHGDLEPCG